jgi:pimeloyl-ACP methyl ester carboxylesterase
MLDSGGPGRGLQSCAVDMARIVLVHGAFAGAWCWERVLPGLRAAGHTVEAFDLPGSGSDQTPIEQVTLDAYTTRVCEVLASGPPAVLAGHSMGGMVVTQAAARTLSHLTALIYVAAFVPSHGQSLLNLTAYPEAAEDQIQAHLVLDGDPPVATLSDEAMRDAVFGCCDEEQAAWGLAHTRGQPGVPFTQPVDLGDPTPEAFAALPRSYIRCLRDHAIPPGMQLRMLTDHGIERVIEIDTDHSPWLSRVDELVAALDRLADD